MQTGLHLQTQSAAPHGRLHSLHTNTRLLSCQEQHQWCWAAWLVPSVPRQTELPRAMGSQPQLSKAVEAELPSQKARKIGKTSQWTWRQNMEPKIIFQAWGPMAFALLGLTCLEPAISFFLPISHLWNGSVYYVSVTLLYFGNIYNMFDFAAGK